MDGGVGEAPVRDSHIPNWHDALGVNINISVRNGFLHNARANAAELQTEVNRQKLTDLRNNIARHVRNPWQDYYRAYVIVLPCLSNSAKRPGLALGTLQIS